MAFCAIRWVESMRVADRAIFDSVYHSKNDRFLGNTAKIYAAKVPKL